MTERDHADLELCNERLGDARRQCGRRLRLRRAAPDEVTGENNRHRTESRPHKSSDDDRHRVDARSVSASDTVLERLSSVPFAECSPFACRRVTLGRQPVHGQRRPFRGLWARVGSKAWPTQYATGAPMRDIYHEDLEALSDSLIEMTRLVGGAMGRATQALIDADVQLADNVIASDDTVDALRDDIEARAFDILARQQ